MAVKHGHHVLIATCSGALARQLRELASAALPGAHLHGPFSDVRQARDYLRERAKADDSFGIDYAITDHELDDDYGFELATALRELLGRTPYTLFLIGEDGVGGAYAKQAVTHVRVPTEGRGERGRLEVALAAFLQADSLHSTGTSLTGDVVRAVYEDLGISPSRGKPVYRRFITQQMQSYDETEPDVHMRMTLGAIAHFYLYEGRVWAQALSGNLNPTPHTLEELEATVDPRSWFRINERQLVAHLCILPSANIVEQATTLPAGAPLRLRLHQTSAFPHDEVAPEHVAAFVKWYAENDPSSDLDDDDLGFDFDIGD